MPSHLMKASRIRTTVVGLVLTVALVSSDRAAAQVGSCTTPTVDAYLDVGNVRARILANGNLFWRGDPYVYEVPKGGGVNALFAAGFWIGGKVDGELRLAAAQYGNFNFWTGPIDENGNPPSNCSDYERIWSVYRADVRAFEEGAEPSDDLASWPTGLGAPTLAPAEGDGVDNDEDGRVDEAGEMKRIHDEILDLPLEQRVDRVIDLEAGERPELVGDQMLWWIMNDNGNEHPRTETPPLGIEVHASAFALDVPGDIGNSTFYRLRVFQKANHAVDSTYVALFSDPDLGSFQDDYMGTDTTLSLVYAYNADNEDEGGYGFAPPAVGHTLLQGSVVPSPGDTVRVSGDVLAGYRNLGMTASMRYSGGGGLDNDPVVASDYYNYMQARRKDGRRLRAGGDGFEDVEAYPLTSYMYTGDPVTRSFWSELNVFDESLQTANPPGERRYMMASGPFRLEPGDVREVAYAVVWARGASNLDSVTQLREASQHAQIAFEVNFRQPRPPDAPDLVATPLDEAVALEWSYRPDANNYQETYRRRTPLGDPDDLYYEFEGYEVVEFADAEDEEGTVIATFDRANSVTEVKNDVDGDGFVDYTVRGSDGGVRRTHLIGSLTNYRTYHFGVRAYAYNAAARPKAYRGPVARIEVRPARTGKLLDSDAISIAYTGRRRDGTDGAITGGVTSGVGGGRYSVTVVNPADVVDADYSIAFYRHEDHPTYDITNVTTGGVVFDGAEYVEAVGDGPRTTTQAGEGLAITVSDPQTNLAPMPFDPYDGERGRPIQREFFMGLDGETTYPPAGTVLRLYSRDIDTNAPEFVGDFDNDGTTETVRAITEVAGPGGSDPCVEPVGCVNGERVVDYPFESSGGHFTMPVLTTQSEATLPDYVPNTYEIRFTDPDPPNGSFVAHIFATQSTALWPVEIWDIGDVGPGEANDPLDDVRMIVVPLSDCGSLAEFNYDCELPDWEHPLSDRLYAYYVSPEYTYEQWTNAAGVVALPNQPGASMTFSTAGLGARDRTHEEQVEALDDIGIVPNPYKAFSDYEVDLASDEVRFTGLPDVATIRVFTLHGTLVRTLEKDSPGLRSLSWDVRNEDGRKLASGMYLIHVDVPGVGERVIKFAMVKDGVVE